MNDADRSRFDRLLESVIGSLPESVAALLDEIPVIIEDGPTPEMLRDLEPPLELEPGEDPAESLCGLHVGVANTEASVEDHGTLPPTVYLFRRGIIATAGGAKADDESIAAEIRITLLHELGHQFGLDEDDLEELGYA